MHPPHPRHLPHLLYPLASLHLLYLPTTYMPTTLTGSNRASQRGRLTILPILHFPCFQPLYYTSYGHLQVAAEHREQADAEAPQVGCGPAVPLTGCTVSIVGVVSVVGIVGTIGTVSTAGTVSRVYSASIAGTVSRGCTISVIGT